MMTALAITFLEVFLLMILAVDIEIDNEKFYKNY